VSKPHSVLVLQHIGCETLGTIADALDTQGVSVQYIRAFDGESVPKELGAAAGLIVMGGPQSVYEQNKFPYLRDELRLIENTLRQEKPILGVCLGSQLLASALGAEVKSGPQKEIGWFNVSLTGDAGRDALFAGVPSSFMGFHWHGDVFDLPTGAVALASSAPTPHQAYRHGRNAYGLLFHMEVTAAQIEEMVATFGDELHAAGVDAREILAGADKYLPALQQTGRTVYNKWAGLLG
jgi:GMP synthase (glutamine-hydrolysing)